MGWPVFPLVPGGKLPLLRVAHRRGYPCRGECGRDGHGFYDATADHSRILRWWTRYPTANIGLRTGIAFDVLDIDSPAAARALEEAGNDRIALPRPVSR